MTLEFPTHLPVHLSQTCPSDEGETGSAAFLEVLSDFLHCSAEQQTTTPRDFADGVHFYDSNQESTGSSLLPITREAMIAVVRNIAQHTKDEYVWDPPHNRWVLESIPY